MKSELHKHQIGQITQRKKIQQNDSNEETLFNTKYWL